MRQFTRSLIKEFQKTICQYYSKNKRSFPWRKTVNPYHILVSEIMLQQTQTERVIQKYNLFIKAFPNFNSLAVAPLRKVLQVWQGMGYNRRAIALLQTAKIVVKKYRGKLPDSVEELIKLPGIGHYSASAICAFAYNQPTTFIETNIRQVYIHFFFQKRMKVNDKEILAFIEQTVDKKNPREWYYALMDYGVMLKKKYPNPNRKSTHYQKQSRFEGSNRQIRGMILRIILEEPNLTKSELIARLQKPADKVSLILNQMQKEGFIKKIKDKFSI